MAQSGIFQNVTAKQQQKYCAVRLIKDSKMIKYSFPKSVTLSQIEMRVNDLFSTARICKQTSTELTGRLMEKVINPINEHYPSGKRKHSVFLEGYVAGLIAAGRRSIWHNDVEFCYLVDGIVYSTHKDSTRPTTEGFYARGEGNIVNNAEGRHYWKGTDKAFS